MANTKTYQLVINGLKESIDAVESLNRQLADVEQRIKAIDGKTININVNNVGGTTGGDTTGGGSRRSELSEIEKIEKEIAKVQEKQAAHQSEEYKALLMEKEALKQINVEQKASIASDNLSAKEYTNTMAELKQHLKDIKAAMQTEEIGSERFKQLTQEANELNNKLKEIETSYGQFGRNVGNYGSAAEGFKGISVEVNGIDRSFKSLSSATKTLRGELGALELNEKGNTEEADRLRERIKELESAMHHAKDASYAMGRAMDWMQSFVAIASVGKGLSALFGIDDNRINESIQKLVALQNLMQSLQTLYKQMTTSDGIGKYFASMNSAIDTGTKKLLVYNRAILGTGKAAKIAAVGVKTLGTALKTIGIGLVIAGVVQLLDLLDKWLHKGKEVTATMQAINDIVGETGQGYAKANINIKMAQKAIDNFNGSAKEEKKLLDQLNSSTGGLVANCKNLDEAKQKIVEHADEYIEMMRLEAQAQALLSLYTSEYAKLIQTQQIFGQQFSGNTFLNDSFDNVMQRRFDQLDNFLEKATELQGKAAEIRNRLFTNENEEDRKDKNETVDIEKELQKLRISILKDGLLKRLIQLEEEKRQTLAKFKENSKAYLEAEKIFEKKRQDIILSERQKLWDRLQELEAKNVDEQLSIERQALKNEIDEINHMIDNGYFKEVALVTPRYTIETGQTTEVEAEYDSMYLTVTKTLSKMGIAENDYTKNLEKNFEDRQDFLKYHFDELTYVTKEYLAKKHEKQEEDLNIEEQQAERAAFAELESYQKIVDGYKDHVNTLNKLRDKEGKFKNAEDEENYRIAKEQLDKALEEETTAEENYENKILNIRKEFKNKKKELITSQVQEESKLFQNGYSHAIEEYRVFLSDLNAASEQQPIMDVFGFIDYKATKDNYDKILKASENFFNQIQYAKAAVFLSPYLTQEQKDTFITQLGDIENAVGETATRTKNMSKQLFAEQYKLITGYIQQLGNALSQMVQAIGDYQQQMYENQINDVQKQIDKYEELLGKQEDITQKHADRINDIEDELANSRGDRRQHLIDSLNSEIQAQRESLAEEKRIEKQKQAKEKQADELEEEKFNNNKKNQKAQAIISGSLAFMNALATTPIWLGMSLAAMTATMTGYQIATINAQKYTNKYADGGIIEGKPHSKGGVKLLGGTVEVEGGEFITNRITTSKNAPLLEYINSNKKKVELSDLIEFYDKKPRKNIRAMSAKFAEGGTLPVVDVSDQLNDIVMVQSQQPIYVTVKDIEDGMSRVSRVRVLAGLKE